MLVILILKSNSKFDMYPCALIYFLAVSVKYMPLVFFWRMYFWCGLDFNIFETVSILFLFQKVNFMGNTLESDKNLNDPSFLYHNILYWENISSVSTEVSGKLLSFLFQM